MKILNSSYGLVPVALAALVYAAYDAKFEFERRDFERIIVNQKRDIEALKMVLNDARTTGSYGTDQCPVQPLGQIE